MTARPERPLVWIDLEMTGLDPDRDLIIEIATIVTDGWLEQVELGPDLVIAAPQVVLDAMDELVRGMHTSSGLVDEVRAATRTVAEAEQETLAFVRGLVPDPAMAPLAGNSVHADRMFLRKWMPTLEAHLHYRNVDVSTLKELARRWQPELVESAPKKAEHHRALADIKESINELRHYRAALFERDQKPASAAG